MREADAHDCDETKGMVFDDVTCEELDLTEVINARRKELEYIMYTGVWNNTPRENTEAMGINVIGARWIDINNVDTHNLIHRSRSVAK